MATTSAKPTSATRNPVIEQYLKNKPKVEEEQPQRQRADISKGSLFAEVEREQAPERRTRMTTRNRDHMNFVLDPDPVGRMRWERKVVIRQVRRRGRLTRAEELKRSERESLAKSEWIKTSVKKLGALARQIAGKPIEEAILQMRFSPKKAAKEVKRHLEYARDAAIVQRGMGLGPVDGGKGTPIEIQLKDGSRKRITDRTGIYVDQAWVGRGTYDIGIDYRARGRSHRLREPWTSMHCVQLNCSCER
jgi:ribosomal protein L22